MGLKMKELVNELNAANLEQETVLTTIAQIRVALYDLVRWGSVLGELICFKLIVGQRALLTINFKILINLSFALSGKALRIVILTFWQLH